MSISPTESPSTEYSSVFFVVVLIDQPFVSERGLSLTCGECPVPYPEPPEPICVVKSTDVPFDAGRFAET
ncbi:MAG: hypothetical protein WCT49_01790 [Candidatus Paceibacterota bacterium]